jgi:hypothetical protein
MKTISVLAVFALGFCVHGSVSAQSRHKTQFQSFAQWGIASGKGAVSGLIQTVNGIQTMGWSAGLGLGLDFYRYRSIPLFLDLRKEFVQKKNIYLVYADGGYHFPWVNADQSSQYIWNVHVQNDYRGGQYFDGGLGYGWKLKKRSALLLSIGYSFKYFRQTSTTYFDNNGSETNVTYYNYYLNRMLLKLGWKF